MLTTLDVLHRNDIMSDVLKLGMKETTMTKEATLSADVRSVTEQVLTEEKEMPFHLKSMMLRGIIVLHCNKVTYVLEICNDVLQKITLKSVPAVENEDSNAKGKNSKQTQQKPNIDDDTRILWEETENLEEIIREEGKDNMFLAPNDFDVSSITLNILPREERSQSPPQIANDFTEPLMELTVDNQGANAEQNEACMAVPSDDDFDGFSIDPSMNQIEPINVHSRNKNHNVDQAPIFSMDQLMRFLSDHSATLCARPIKKLAPSKTVKIADDILLSNLYVEAKKIAAQYSITRRPMIDENEDLDAPTFIPDLPEEYEITEEIEKDETSHNIEIATEAILPEIKNALQWGETVPLLEIVKDNDRILLARSFYAALTLKTLGIIELIQPTKSEPILIAEGPSFKN